MSSALRISIGLNLVLAGVVVLLLWRDRLAAPAAVAPPPAFARAEVVNASPRVEARKLQPGSAGGGFSPAAVAQLEQMGLSRRVVGSALLEEFNRRWDERLIDLERRHAPKRMAQRDYIEFARIRELEQIRELKEAFGEEGYRVWDKERTLRQLNSTGLPLTAEEAEQAYRLQKDFDEKHKELQMAMEDGVADPADGATLQAQAQEALNRDLEQLFGKQRLDEMRGLTNPSAEVSWRYGDLSPTQEQTNAVLRTDGDYREGEAALVRRLNDHPATAANVAAELKALNDAREENLRGIFGAAAYEQSKRRNDPTYQTLQQYAGAWAIAETKIQPVYDAVRILREQTDLTRAAAAMREAAGQPVNWREINAVIEQTRQQTETTLQTLVGDETLRRLKQNGLLNSP
ncbi:MAG TPA: hypothetical protein VEA63_11375 [Opitutus sp.]|nr:hypothetical protein [Opitutus sp.]